MLEPDVDKRINMKEISESPWLSESLDLRHSHSLEEDDLSALHLSNSLSTNSKTLYRLHPSRNCSCESSSDSSY